MSDDCPICCYPLGKEPIGACVPCGHVAHVTCFEAWAQHMKSSQRHVKCPMCNESALQFVKIFLDLSPAVVQNEEASEEDETVESSHKEEEEEKDEKVQRYQEMQNEIAELHQHLDNNVFSLTTIELTLQRKDREFELLRLEYQASLLEKEQVILAMVKSEERLRALQVSLQRQTTELFAKYGIACATSPPKECELLQEFPKEANKLLKHQLLLQQDQQQPSIKRPRIEINGDFVNAFKRRRTTGKRDTPSPEENIRCPPQQSDKGDEASCANSTTAAIAVPTHSSNGDGNPSSKGLRDQNDSEFQKIRQKQKRLLLLHHSVECTVEKGDECFCMAKGCAKMKSLRLHMEGCQDHQCSFPHCCSTRAMLSHYRTCEDTACLTCTPVRVAVKTSSWSSCSAWADLQHQLL